MGECGGLPFSPFTCFIRGLRRENYFFAGNFAVCIDKSGGMGYDYSGGCFAKIICGERTSLGKTGLGLSKMRENNGFTDFNIFLRSKKVLY